MDLANRLLIMPHYLSCLISYFFFFYGVLLAVVGLFARDIALLAFGMLPSIVPTSNFQEGLLVFVISGFFMVGILDSEVVKSCGTFEQLLEMFGR